MLERVRHWRMPPLQSKRGLEVMLGWTPHTTQLTRQKLLWKPAHSVLGYVIDACIRAVVLVLLNCPLLACCHWFWNRVGCAENVLVGEVVRRYQRPQLKKIDGPGVKRSPFLGYQECVPSGTGNWKSETMRRYHKAHHCVVRQDLADGCRWKLDNVFVQERSWPSLLHHLQPHLVLVVLRGWFWMLPWLVLFVHWLVWLFPGN